MKIPKFEFRYLGQLIITWTFINITLNMFGLFFTKLLNEVEYAGLENITNEFIKPLAIQSLLFTICLSVAFIGLKNKKWVPYAFVAVQCIVFHFIFVVNLKIHHGLHFETTFHNIGLQYLSYSGQYVVDILYLYFPIDGVFEDGKFMPANILTFYIHWIFLNILYYMALTWLAIQSMKFLFETKNETNFTESAEESQPDSLSVNE